MKMLRSKDWPDPLSGQPDARPMLGRQEAPATQNQAGFAIFAPSRGKAPVFCPVDSSVWVARRAHQIGSVACGSASRQIKAEAPAFFYRPAATKTTKTKHVLDRQWDAAVGPHAPQLEFSPRKLFCSM